MSQGPFGNNPSFPGDDEQFRAMFEQYQQFINENVDESMRSALNLPDDPAAFSQMMAQVQRMMSMPNEGPVNWTLASDTARQVTAQSGDSTVGEAARRACLDALRLADHWLDGVTSVPAAASAEQVWSRAEWVEATLPTWRRLTVPVAESVSKAIMTAIEAQIPEQMRAMAGQAGGMLTSLGGSVFGAQVGQAVGTLAGEVVSSTDVGLPLAKTGTRALVPDNVDAFGEGLDVPIDEVRLYLAVREAAHARLFAHAGWLGARLLGAVEQYARGITIDTSRIESALSQVDPTNPQALQEAMASGMFEPERSPAQEAALQRLETTLALVEGWVDVVTDAACSQLPHAGHLREAVRRRRATGGPAEHTFASLVGLELRPRRLRDGVALWAALEAKHGREARDEIWDHPDLMPGTEDLDDPLAYAERWGVTPELDDIDAGLAALLDAEDKKSSGGEQKNDGRESGGKDDESGPGTSSPGAS